MFVLELIERPIGRCSDSFVFPSTVCLSCQLASIQWDKGPVAKFTTLAAQRIPRRTLNLPTPVVAYRIPFPAEECKSICAKDQQLRLIRNMFFAPGAEGIGYRQIDRAPQLSRVGLINIGAIGAEGCNLEMLLRKTPRPEF